MTRLNPSNRCSDRARDIHPRPLCGGSRFTGPASQPDCLGQFLSQKLHLVLQLLNAAAIIECLRFLKFGSQLSEVLLISCLSLSVEHVAGIAQPELDAEFGRQARSARSRLAPGRIS